MKKRRRWPRVLGALALLLILGGLFLFAVAFTALGQGASGARLERMKASPQWKVDHFVNVRPAVQAPLLKSSWDFFTGGSEHTNPEANPVPLVRKRADFDTPPASGLRVTWLGHSTLLLEIDGRRVLTDPVWGERASPFSFLGPKRWYAPPLALDELPELDAILISHDHYDHLDHPTVVALKDLEVPWLVPLGVGAHLAYWGVPEARIIELDWWDESTVVAGLTITATPARHFSGRIAPPAGGGPTLWAGWSIAGPEHRAYYSGDTALFDGLVDIGAKLGPFDLTMIESGAYNQSWTDVHLGPEQAVRAHQLVGGKAMLPVHWGLFELAAHGWTEPMERVLVAAAARGVTTLTPRPGEMVEPASAKTDRWWPDVPWETAADRPVLSSGVRALMED